MRIVILGATGQIGKFIVKRLTEDYLNAEIIPCSRVHLERHFRFHPFENDWNRLGKVDVLINSIGIIEPTPELSFEKAHEEITSLILQNRKIIGEPRIIQISVLGADVSSPAPFLNTKAKADQMLLLESNGVVVRPSIVCTPGTVIVQKMKLLKKISEYFGGYLPFPVSILKTKIQPVMGSDLAAIISKLCTSEKTGIVKVVGPEEISIRGLIKHLSPDIKIIPLNQRLANICVRILSRVFPGLINKSQYELLLADNTGDKAEAEKYLARPLKSTMNFWKNEFK